jgi:hypothetical protein
MVLHRKNSKIGLSFSRVFSASLVYQRAINRQSAREKRWQPLFLSRKGGRLGYPRRKKREELKKPKPEKKRERKEKQKKKKLARLERQQYG